MNVSGFLMRRGSIHGSLYSRLLLCSLALLWALPCTAQNCELYPIALSMQSVSNAAPNAVLSNILNGAQSGNFGWLTWAGSPSVPTLVTSLTAPGDSHTYVNPDDPNDHVVSTDDWVQGKPGVSNSKNVRDALDALKTIDITVPVWNQTRGQGNNADYRVAAFARVRLLSYSLPGQNKITARFLGFTSCGANQAPVVDAGPDQVITNPSAATLHGTVTDDGVPVGGVLTAHWSQVSGTGSVSFASSNALNTTATFSLPGEYTLRLTATDSELASSDDIVITVNNPNHPPEATPQSVMTPEDVPLDITLAGQDADADPLTYSVDLPPSFGQLSGTPPNMTYTPTNDYNGPDSFTFKVNDGQLDSAPATVSITVISVNDAPVAEDIAVTNFEDAALLVQMSGADVDGDSNAYEIVDNPQRGLLGGVSSNTVLYTPLLDYNGNDAFTYRVFDGELYSSTATVSLVLLPVNDPPVAQNQTVTLDEDAAAGILLTASDVDGDALTFEVLAPPNQGTLNGVAPNLTYAPAENFNDNDSLTFRVFDGLVYSGTATVSIVVNPVNDAPTADSQGVSLDEDTSLSVLLNASDVDGDALTFSVVQDPSHGALTGTPPNLTYIPDPDYNGSDIFTFVANDGSTDSAPAVVSVTVIPVNDTPAADSQAVAGIEDTPVSIGLTGSDIDGDALAFAIVYSPTSGILSGTAPDVVYTPNPNFHGADSFMFVAADSSATSAPATIRILVAPVNDVPTSDPQTLNTTEDTALDVVLTGADIDGDALTFAVEDGPSHGSLSGTPPNLAYTPAADYNGPDSFTFFSSDSFASSAVSVISISVAPINDAPVAQPQAVVTDEDTALPVTLAGYDVDGDTLTRVVVNAPTNGVLSGIAPNLTYEPNPNFYGADSFTFVAVDSSATSAVSAVEISVLPINDPPTADAGPDQLIDFPSNAVLSGVVMDIDGPVSAAWAQISGPGTPSFVDADSAATAVSFSEPGVYVLRLTANDSELTASDDITITVNGAPAVNAGTDQTATPGDTITLSGTATDDGLPPGSSLDVAWSRISGPAPVLFGTPNAAATSARVELAGDYVLRLTATDSRQATFDEVTVSVRSAAQNQAPTANAGPDQTIGLTDEAALEGSFSDDALPFGSIVSCQWSVVSGPGSVAFADAAHPKTTATFGQNGTYVLQLTADDGQLATSDDVTIVLFPANLPPTVDAGMDQTVDSPYADLHGQIVDDGLPTGSVISVQWSVVSGPGTVTFENAALAPTRATVTAQGVYVLRLSAFDGQLTATDDLTVTVVGNQPPVVDAGPDLTSELFVPPVLSTPSNPPPQSIPDRWLYDIAQPGVYGSPPGANGYCGINRHDIQVEDGKVYISGTFLYANGLFVGGVGMWDTCGWSAFYDPRPLNPAVSNSPPIGYNAERGTTGAAPWQHRLYILGDLKDLDHNGHNDMVDYWSGTGWEPCTPIIKSSYVSMWAIIAQPRGVYLCGTYLFTTSSVPTAQISFGIAKWNGSNWCALGTGIRNTNDTTNTVWAGAAVHAVAEGPDGQVYAGGNFHMTNENGVMDNIARWDGTNWWPMGQGISGNWGGYAPCVYDVCVGPRGDVYAAGMFTNAGGGPAYCLARWDGTNWSKVSTNEPAGYVVAITFRSNDLYVGGGFGAMGNQQCKYVARWDGTNWWSIGDGTSNGCNSECSSIASGPDGIYVGGYYFTAAGGKPASRIARYGHYMPPTLDCVDPITAANAPPDGADVVVAPVIGHPCGYPLTVTWNVDGGPAEWTNVVSGAVPPLAVPFTNHYAVGVHPLTITVSDGGRTPTLTCNTRVTVLTPATAILAGSVTDDGLPAGVTNALWAMVSGPSSIGFDCQSCPLTTASFDQPGTYVLRLTGDDTEYTAFDEMTVQIKPIGSSNQPPSVNAGLDQSITFGEAASLEGTASDDSLPTGSLVTVHWSLVTGPGTATFLCPTCTVTIVSFDNTGTYILRLTASDGELSYNDDVVVQVNPNLNQPPSVDAGADTVVMFAEEEPLVYATLNGTVSDDGLPSGLVTEHWSLVSGPGNALFKYRDGHYEAVFAAPGTYTLMLSADDGQKATNDEVTVTVLAYVAPPIVEILSPTNTQQVSAPTAVIGTVDSPVVASWQLQYRLVPSSSLATPEPPGEGGSSSSNSYSILATGTTAIVCGELGTLDPTLLINGTYELRVVASDLAGRGSTSEVQSIIVAGSMKVGLFTLSFEDLSVPLAGIPIQVVRTYDSRNAMAGKAGDFGIGWTMSLKDVRLQKNRALGTHWKEEITGFIGGLGIPRYEIAPVRDRTVTVTLPDNKVYRFKVVLNPAVQAGVPIVSGNLVFQPLPGTYGTLAVEGDNVVQVMGDVPYYDPFGGQSLFSGFVDLVDPFEGNDFDPQLFRFTTEDGTAYIVHETAGLQKVIDLNGNEVEYTSSGIFHGSGESVRFVRDSADRIIQILDPASNVLTYTYSTNNDLVAFTDRTTNTTTLQYSSTPSPHLLRDILDPRGVRAVRSEYDDAGRLISQTDADGNPIVFTHDVENRRETITDRLGHVTIHEYDDRGNVVKTIDALSNATIHVYDDLDNEIRTIDALGHPTTFTYDARGNKLTETDSLSNTVTYAYNSFSQPLTITDARGNTTLYTYDTKGNLLSEQDALSNRTTYVYDLQGNMLSRTDALSNRWEYGYDELGHQTSEVVRSSALDVQRSTFFTYDANGNQLTRSWQVSSFEFQVSNTYDSANRLIATVHPDGSVTRTEYNAIGKESKRIDQLNRETTYEYDDRGNLTVTHYPDGTTESTEYDEEGRKVVSVDRMNRTTSYSYDPLGHLTDTVYPDGAVVSSVYDEVGRVITAIDARDSETHYEYEDCSCGQRQANVTDALGHTTHFEYDENGNRTVMTDANGHTTHFTYDALNRQVASIGPMGPIASQSYDALGRRISQTDAAGLTTSYGYDTLGRLTSVTDALSQVTSYGYDEQGNLVRQTDANNHSTTFEYDSMGRRVKRTLPEGQVETYSYDVVGNMTNKVDFNGKVTTFAYDELNRLTAKIPDASFAASNILFTYTDSGQRQTMSDQSGVTTYSYDDRDRLMEKATPQGTLSYAYDPHGNLTNLQVSSFEFPVSYSYDSLNRLHSVLDPHTGLTAYNYDDVGNLRDFILPNGVNQVYDYDTLNRLTNLVVNSLTTPIESYRYTLGPSGHRLAVQEGNGRQVTYQYDNLYRLTKERILGASPLGDVSYGFDPVGNRLAMTSTVFGIPSQVNTFDANDRLGSDSYDPNGNTTAGTIHDSLDGTDTAFTYSYDFENRILSATSAQSAVQLLYDGDGNRVGKTVTDAFGTRTTRYLVDQNNLTGYSQVLAEMTLNLGLWTLDRSYTVGLDVISQSQLLTTNSSLLTSYYGYDGHGNTRFLTDTNGVITDRWDYDAFGNVIARSGTTANNLLYCGEYRDPDLGLYFLRARYMETGRGRFWSMDAFNGFSASPLSLHKYAYAQSNPVLYTDPSGRFTLSELMTVSMVIGILAVMADPERPRLEPAKCQDGMAPTADEYAMVRRSFPNLLKKDFRVTERAGNGSYNCIASTIGATGGIWPDTSLVGDKNGTNTIEEFEAFYRLYLGLRTPANVDDAEVVVYLDELGVPTHAARRYHCKNQNQPGNFFESKLGGPGPKIIHELNDLTSHESAYPGEPILFRK